MVWHSRTGAAEQMAQAVAQGAQVIATALGTPERLRLRVLPADQAQPEHLLAASAYAFIAPENLASLSGAMKEFFDRNYYAVLEQLNGRPYCAIVTAGSDGQGALQQMQRICTGWRLQAVAPGLIVPLHAQSAQAIWAPKTVPDQYLQQGIELGGTLAALLL